MALIEIELDANTFENLAFFVLSKSPIPAPTFDLLGPTRLVSKPILWSTPICGTVLPGGTLPPGTLALQATAVISHVSVAELIHNPLGESQKTECVAWMIVTLEPTRVKIDLVRLEQQGGPVQVFAMPLVIGQQVLPFGLEDIRATALLRNRDVVTVRYSVGGSDDVLQAPANRLEQARSEEWPYEEWPYRDPVPSALPDTWLFRVSGEVFANQMRDELANALAGLPRGTTVEMNPIVSWYQQQPPKRFEAQFDSGPGSLKANQWGAVGTVGIKQKDACPGVDISVTIRATLTLLPTLLGDITKDRLTLGLRLSSNVDDDDAFRCWITYGGLAATVFATAMGDFVDGLMIGLGTAVAVGELIRLEAGRGVTKQRAGSFEKVDSDDTAVWYSGSRPLARLPNGVGLSGRVGAEGLLIKGGLSPPFAGVDHTITFEPDGGTLDGHWSGSYDCATHRWHASYLVQPIMVRDLIVQAGRVVEGPGTIIFPTSRFISPFSPALLIDPGEWTYDAPTLPTGSPIVTPRRTSPPPVGDRMYFILHTNAGIRRYEIGPVPVTPPDQLAPSGIMLGMLEVQCRMTTRHWNRIEQLHWLVDPPPFDYGIPAVRQWLLRFRELPETAEVRMRSVVGNRDVEVAHGFRGSQSGFIEFLSEDATSTSIEHNLGETNAEVRIKQRWLLPTSRFRLGGQAEGLSAVYDDSGTERVLVKVNRRTFVVQSGELEEWLGAEQPTHSARPKSVALRNGQIAVVSNDILMIAVPWSPN